MSSKDSQGPSNSKKSALDLRKILLGGTMLAAA
jgi:hypothetical protein